MSSHTCEADLAPFLGMCTLPKMQMGGRLPAFLSSNLIGKETWTSGSPACSVENAVLSFLRRSLEAARSSAQVNREAAVTQERR